VDGRDYERALILLSEAMEKIQALEEIDDETFKFEQERSLNALQELSAQIQKNRPLTEIEQLERQLRRAIERQEFERAAELRDRIRELKKHGIC
jgi:excinuclease UvrABC helicase subunit UvrB